MALDRWIALIILVMSLGYGYTAFFTMDGALAPFMRNNPIWPSTFPKVLSVMAIVAALIILLGFEKNEKPREEDPSVIVYRRLLEYQVVPALTLIGLMIAYALLLRPIGFLTATVGFLTIGSLVLGERRLHILIPVAVIAAGSIWYLVQEVLGIFLRPWPAFMGV
ncbi:tripartite tricarboxylate transporter TctB family protein [Cognatiyoonia sp. IB215446]|uniref:tripartite tricarboxylate transporter TctB family protein n=1 Tax=Cognatiyoonia sp. IB215446 TaxID=3097355 RepID=UPI002A13069A|nr:tripartite tricarboxylate transporter TctB family protein [Cognatiyoonia sp. IB215446]MDX8349475.1 tripartite tricarboxylate transporter TctB family protein [Cognatiyoonia sp. IB215446]